MASQDTHQTESARASPGDTRHDSAEYARAQKSKFRFKSSKRKSSRSEDGESRRHRHHHRTKRHKSAHLQDDPSLHDDTYLPNTSSEQYLDPDTAFRESLFDAMADDEGAQFWEGVYGQPIPKIDPVKEGPQGDLETMTEEEYAAHVRAEMYKKTHQYLFEERARREAAKKERDRLSEQARQEEEEARRFQKQVEESLRRGRNRKEKAQRSSSWATRWREYEVAWEQLQKRSKTNPTKIPWPSLRGTKDSISKEDIEDFFLNAPSSGQPDKEELSKTLKLERIRWHPDKIQQKLGGQDVDEATMRTVTAVFQIIDRLWNDVRDRKS